MTPKHQLLADIARSLIGNKGTAYQGAAALDQDPASGFDCSGLVRYALKLWEKETGIPLLTDGMRHCSDFADAFGVLIHPEYIQPGDLVFFSHDGGRIQHMGIVTSEDTYVQSQGHTNSKRER